MSILTEIPVRCLFSLFSNKDIYFSNYFMNMFQYKFKYLLMNLIQNMP